MQAPNLNQTEEIVKLGQGINYADLGQACVDNWRNGSRTYDKANVASSPIPLPAIPHDNSPGRDLYYVSARSLSRSHTPTVGSFLAQRMSPTSYPIRNSIAEPLLDADGSTRSAPDLKPKTMLCVVFVVAFLGILGLHESSDNRPAAVYGNKNQGFVLQLGRKLLQLCSFNKEMVKIPNTEPANQSVKKNKEPIFSSLLEKEMVSEFPSFNMLFTIMVEMNTGTQVNGGMLHETDIVIGSILGWAMAAIYMGGRLPQIFLNIKRGNVEVSMLNLITVIFSGYFDNCTSTLCYVFGVRMGGVRQHVDSHKNFLL
ncbi:hypothetical protein JCGZ_26732 [Jatropha curcas]|uniref:Uncharacterized protein n=1 Tax=Jatropha curcas TaxID=180498 RepID=A0A067JMI9_JATCU|nr:hypothetical protein JCGZ_26732 [Jatropha curcas]